jgi:hypothetical protein
MADKGDSSSMATQLARQAADQAHSLGSWLENREPGDVLGEVKRFARRKPGAFLAIAAGAGFLSGRLTRGLTGGSESGQASGDSSGTASGYTSAYTGQTSAPRYESTTTYDASTGSTFTSYGTTGARDTGSRSPGTGYAETGISTTGQSGEISEASRPSAASAPGAPPGDVMGSAWEEGER